MITQKVAYRMGFYCALNPDSISAYQDMARFGFSGCTDGKIVSAFIRGYSKCIRRLKEVGKPLDVHYEFESEDQKALFKL